MRHGLLLLSVLFIFACKEEVTYHKLDVTSESITKTWRLTEIVFDDAFYNSTGSHEKRVIQGQIGQGYLLTLFPDKVASRLIDNKFEVLEWEFSADSILFVKNELTKDTFYVLGSEENKGYRFLECRYKNIGKYKFVEEHDMLSDITLDPYHPSLNTWRKAASEYETNAQLRKRIMNYLDHQKALLLSSSKRPNTKIRLKNSLGPLRIFDGGIGLKPKEQLPKEWLHTYFSDSQGYEVYDRLNKHFTKRIMSIDSTHGWRVDDYNLIDSLQKLY